MAQALRPYERPPSRWEATSLVATPGLAAASLAFKIMIEWASLLPEWGWIPFGKIAVGIFIFGAGQWLASWSQPRSWLRVRYSKWRRFYDVVSVITPTDNDDLVFIKADIKFLKDISSASAYLHIKAVHSIKPDWTVQLFDYRRFSQGVNLTLDIATVSISGAKPSFFGSDPNASVVSGGKYQIDCRVSGDGVTQAFTFDMVTVSPSSGTMGKFALFGQLGTSLGIGVASLD